MFVRINWFSFVRTEEERMVVLASEGISHLCTLSVSTDSRSSKAMVQVKAVDTPISPYKGTFT